FVIAGRPEARCAFNHWPSRLSSLVQAGGGELEVFPSDLSTAGINSGISRGSAPVPHRRKPTADRVFGCGSRSGNPVPRRFAGEKGVEIVEGSKAHRVPCFARGTADMRQEKDVLQLPVAPVDRRLVLEYVQPGGGDLTGFQRPYERVVIDDRSARGIGDHGSVRQERDPALVQQVTCLGCERTVQREEISVRQELFYSGMVSGR